MAGGFFYEEVELQRVGVYDLVKSISITLLAVCLNTLSFLSAFLHLTYILSRGEYKDTSGAQITRQFFEISYFFFLASAVRRPFSG